MKTFNEKDLITWSNREKAVIGNEYYFGDTLDGIQQRFKDKHKKMLTGINGNNISFPFIFINKSDSYACILPVEAVKEEEKKYRACRNVKELYELVSNLKSKMSNEECICDLIGTTIHFKLKGFDTTVYECITGIAVYINGDIAVHIKGDNFELDELFKNYEIEINGEWVPFGVEE